MSTQREVIEKIQTEQHGTERPFRCIRYSAANYAGHADFATHHLAWADGENWKGLNTNHSYQIIEKGKDKTMSAFRDGFFIGTD